MANNVGEFCLLGLCCSGHFIYFLKDPKKFGAWVKYNKQNHIVNTLFKIFSQFVYFFKNVVMMQP